MSHGDGLVSTIIPVHNRPRLLCEAVESVLCQTYRPIEIIIVDDGSTDHTAAVAEQLQRAHPEMIRWVSIVNGGPGLAREAGRRQAQGEFIQYLDSDDLLRPRKFEIQVAALRAAPKCAVAYGVTKAYAIGAPLPDAPWKRTGEKIEAMLPSLLQSRWWDTSTPLYRREVTDRAGPWSALRVEEDWEYDCRIGGLGVALAFCNAHVSDTRFHAGPMLSRPGRARAKANLQDRARAHKLIFRYATWAGVSEAEPEMRSFARALFLMSRRCGAAGLSKEAKSLFALARRASGEKRAHGLDFVCYQALAGGLGWSLAGLLACGLDRLRL